MYGQKTKYCKSFKFDMHSMGSMPDVTIADRQSTANGQGQ